MKLIKKDYLNVIRFQVLIILLTFTVSCEKVEDLLTFEVRDSTEFTIPSLTGINSPVNIPAPPIESSSSEAFENNNTSASLVKNVILKQLNLTITDPEQKPFKFLKSIEIYISAEDVEEILLASKYDIPEDQASPLVLDPTSKPLDAYIKKNLYNLRTVVQVKEIPGEDVTVKADMVFRVTADPL